jgi:8-oxo-dGTP diphosphatase
VPEPATVLAAGALVWRDAPEGPQILVIHRPKYDDWSIPKGKLDPGEHAVVAAVREVAEETGVRVRLGPPLPSRRYRLADGSLKDVRYWLARQRGDRSLSGAEAAGQFQPNAEVDEVAWLPVDDARHRLTATADIELLDVFGSSAPPASTPFVVLRHARALPRKQWSKKDSLRPLSQEGKEQAQRLPQLLGAYGVEVVVSSDAIRCLDSVRPFVDDAAIQIRVEHDLSEEADRAAAGRLVAALADDSRPTVVCTHRPVLPAVFAAIDLTNPKLEPGELIVVHRRDGALVATERHSP